MTKGTTESGFKYEVNENVFKDMRFLSLMRKAYENPMYYDDLFVKVFGEEQTEALYKHVEDREGYADAEMVSKEFIEVMQTAGDETKNS